MSATELVIFDCDGVLVDSETIVCRVLAEEMNKLGLKTTPEELDEQFSGRPARDCLLEIETRYGGPLPEHYFHNTERRIREAFHNELQPVCGIEDVLDHLLQINLPSCVASSGSHEKMQLTLNKTGLYDYFDGRIFSADDVSRGKPWPDLFLHAAEVMGVEPRRCLVVEDSIAGVRAAVAAGMPVVGYNNHPVRAPQLAQAGAKVVGDLVAVLDFL
ncbi:HAD family hydrolase [Microbulbifer thermotolerans]|uniref:HAD family hydrolase n=1 Tax=Microbulbifer thermotolerans TaxID=252514 RepID=UPI0009F4ADBD|nr:HAD family hydrolase [Microbulbifer thermotolerans]MCX2780923.1 HAD family hydrolase [Microbulbifer thermotolerans]MCX2782092.1 HAD family hydrolase [Microbulbifer thermotolerans]MCX2796373.1 HAD family hydrolase [Microbulbifer thermotolerans]MCX2806262.1 HAD family hydrolase [Microbulbifer thermotolerans]MCX2832761.1 HAD family hydrolase [Microbulbifer thermotolerans]